MDEAIKKKVTNTNRGYVRYLVAIMAFVNCVLVNYHRIIIGVAIVAMVKHKHLERSIQPNSTELSCPLPTEYQNATVFKLEGDLEWSSELQGYVLGSSYVGYIATQLPGGKWAETWGAKKTIFTGNILAAIFTFITPLSTWWNVYAVIAVQFLRGLAQGFCTSPAVFVLMANWFPQQERGFLSSIVICGFATGASLAGVVTGWLCDIPHFGWPSAFYFGGVFSAIMTVLFAFVVHETPQVHPNITLEELKYITEGQECDLSLRRPPTPWRKIFTSVSVCAMVLALFGHYWSINYFFTVHPTYVGTILHFSMTGNGAASGIPILLNMVGALVASFLTNLITKKNCMSMNQLRKSFNFVGSLGFSLCLLGAYFAKCDHFINIVCFSISLFCSGIAVSGAMIACMDMSPRFSGSLMGIASTFAGTSNFIIPVMVGSLTKNETIEEWHSVFFISIAIVLSCGLIFIFFGSAEVQLWNDPEFQDNKKTAPEDSISENKESSEIKVIINWKLNCNSLQLDS